MTHWMWSLHPAQRFVLRTSRTPLRWLWLAAYALVGLADVLYLTRGRRDTTVYLNRSATTREFLPGLSDLDLVFITTTQASARRMRRRQARLERRLPWLRAVLDRPLIYSEPELADLLGANAFTYGLGSSPDRDRGSHFGADASRDAVRTIVLPGLDPPAPGWRRLAGRDRRPHSSPGCGRDAHAQRVACWLELSNWWRIVFPLAVAPSAPNAAGKCVKLLADTAATWLRLALNERPTSREDALRRALTQAPQEEEALRCALALHRSLPDSPAAPLEEILPAFARFSLRIVQELVAGSASAAVTTVRLAGAEPQSAGRALPLCDWVGLAWPTHAQPSFLPASGDIDDPARLAALTHQYRPGAYRALMAPELVVLPAPTLAATRLRAIKCPPADPVVFAVAAGSDVALFPELAGWSAMDTARRATAEHRAWLRSGVGRVADLDATTGDISLLLTAARAALFLESVIEREPVLTVSAAATAERLGARMPGAADLALESAAACADPAAAPPRSLVMSLRRIVCQLPAYTR